MPDPIVRALGIDDAEAYVALRREMLRADPWSFASSVEDDWTRDPNAVAASLGGGDGNTIVGGFIHDRLVGAAGVMRDRHVKMMHRAWIVGVYVSAGSRGAGVGRSMMNAAIDVARAWEGVDVVSLSVSERALEARELYESLGFEAWGVEPMCMKIGDESAGEIHMQLRV